MVGTKPIKSPQLSLAFFRFASNLIVSFFSVCLFYRIGKDSFKTVEYQAEEFCGKKGERYRIIEHTLLALSNSDTNANWLSPFVCSTNRFVLIFLCHGFFCESFLSCASTYDIYIWGRICMHLYGYIVICEWVLPYWICPWPKSCKTFHLLNAYAICMCEICF